MLLAGRKCNCDKEYGKEVIVVRNAYRFNESMYLDINASRKRVNLQSLNK